MTVETFNGQRILATGAGQCLQCKAHVARLLVGDLRVREWITADFITNGYALHTCGTGPEPEPESMKEAA